MGAVGAITDTPEMDSELDLDQSFTEHPSDGDYSQSPVKRPKWAIMPLKSNHVFIALGVTVGLGLPVPLSLCVTLTSS